jgi:hypothetical protein
MLDIAVWKAQLSPNGADIRAGGMRNHLGKPIWPNNLYIIIQKAKISPRV